MVSNQKTQRPEGGKNNKPLPASAIRLSGVSNGKQWNGTGVDSAGTTFTWTATLVKEAESKTDSVKKKENPSHWKVIYPFEPLDGRKDKQPKQETFL